MAYYRGPILKRYAQKRKAEQYYAGRPLSPLPELQEFSPQRDIADQPTGPMPPLSERDESKRITGLTYGSLARFSKINRLHRRKSGTKSPGTGKTPIHPKQLKQRRRARRSCLVLSVLLFALFTLSGLLITGLYVTETSILGPLARFFHPINGDATGSIDGHAWNLLLLGSDNDQKFVFPDLLTQVMMVIRVNPFNSRVSLVSIPRDSWVLVPGQGMHKIDQAFFLGASPRHSFDDGVRLARATIEQDYGIPIDRYAWVGLDGFARVINTLGGVDIDVTHPIVDDTYPDDINNGVHKANPYAAKRLYLAPGPQHLNGEQALEYVRSRHADLVGDIGRTQRQQEVLQTLKKKLDISTIFNHLSELFHDLSGKVYTDLNQSEIISVGSFARDLSAGAVQRLTLGPGKGAQNYGTLTRTSGLGLDDSQDIVLPNCATIQPVVNRIFDLGDTQSCQVNGQGIG